MAESNAWSKYIYIADLIRAALPELGARWVVRYCDNGRILHKLLFVQVCINPVSQVLWSKDQEVCGDVSLEEKS